MRYLGMDVHAKSTVWCLVDAQGEVGHRCHDGADGAPSQNSRLLRSGPAR